ncbi:hypothetical protein CABS03_14680 [Colletotrichum abscissum]|uniref:Uncharacterized protein n=1 Tax=Colletotrichum abscissum TaxID=1671311 RepID=A0A9P9XPZ8_9PEZI|nr:hypothetical protein CSPX01_01296 [Colletotrichum filicis]KAI3557593.1 hypothetical protein CABS02_02252 [Colletotrichum abscissum]
MAPLLPTLQKRRQREHRRSSLSCPPKVSRSMARVNRRFVELVSPFGGRFR